MLRRIPTRSTSSGHSRKSSRKTPLRSRVTAKNARSNGSMTLREALASRTNPSSRKRSNGMSLREALAARSNGLTRHGDDGLSTKVDAIVDKYREVQRDYAADPSETNKRLVKRYREMLESATKSLKSYGKGKAKAAKKKTAKKSTRKSTTRRSTTASAKTSSTKRSSAKKSSRKVTKSKSGVAQSTAAYKRLRSSGSKTKFSRAFNTAFKKAKRSGKSVASAQRSALSAAKKAAGSRKNPASAAKKKSLSALASAAKTVTRSNPRKKTTRKSTRKTAAKKTTAKKTTRKSPRTSSAVSVHAKRSKQYRALRSASKKTAFLKEFKKAFASQNRKRGVTEAQAAARAALIANAKVNSAARKRRNPASSVAQSAVSRMNPRKKTTRKSSKKKTTRKSSSRKSSVRASSLEAAAKSSSLYKRLKSASLKKAFIAHFKKVHAKVARKASSKAQANARAAMSAWGKVTKGNVKRNNPSACRANPRKSSSRKSSSRKSSSSKRARGQRMKSGMRKSAKQALSVAGIYTYKVVIGGKVHTLRVSKSSSVYKSAKKGGLKAVKLSKLRGKKNTPTSLNLRSVYKVVDGRPTKKDFQRAINAWAGAVDGGKIRGISKKMRSRTRMNPASLRKHTVTAISNPMPQSMAMRMYRHNERSGMDTAKLVGIGLGSTYATAIASNFFSSLLHRDFALNITAEDREKNSSKKILAEALPPAIFGLAGGIGLYQKFVKKADVPDAWVAFSGGMVTGAVASVLSRTVVKGMSKFIPGFRSVASYGGDNLTLAEVGKKEEEKAKAAEAEEAKTESTETPKVVKGYLLDLQNKGNNMSRLSGRGLGRYVHVPSQMGAYVEEAADVDSMGLYVENTGRYVEQRSNPADRIFGIARADIRSNPAGGISPVGANTQMVPNRAPVVPDGMFKINASGLREDMELCQPLSNAELDAEGLTEVYANGDQLHVICATPDVARQIVESNFGSIIGPSRVHQGCVLVLASIFDTPQAPVLTDRLRLNRAPEVPKGASFPQAGGVFSRVAFSSHLPSINNQATYQEFGVKVR